MRVINPKSKHLNSYTKHTRISRSQFQIAPRSNMKLRSQRYALCDFLLSLFIASSVSATEQCRCLFGDPCWPTDAEFAGLASQLSRPLIYPTPPASVCYGSFEPSPACATATLEWFDGNWRANQSGAMQSTNFESFFFPNGTISACYINTTLGFPCQQGSVPVIGVDARSVEDIQHGVKFAAAHNLRLVVKGTGSVQLSCICSK